MRVRNMAYGRDKIDWIVEIVVEDQALDVYECHALLNWLEESLELQKCLFNATAFMVENSKTEMIYWCLQIRMRHKAIALVEELFSDPSNIIGGLNYGSGNN